MSKSIASTVGLIIILGFLSIAVVFHTCQVNHYETLILESRTEISNLSRRINRLASLIESGQISSSSGGDTTATTSQWPPVDESSLSPIVLAQRRYYTEDEWRGLHAPGNFVGPRLELWSGSETQEGGTLTRAFQNDIPGLSPFVVNSADVSEVQRYINRRLANRARSNPDVWEAELAYRIEPNEDWTQWHIWLRHGVQWHPPAVDLQDSRYAWLRGDHELVAADFEFYFDIIRDPAVEAAFARNYFEDFDRIEIINDHEFIVHWNVTYFHAPDTILSTEPTPRWLYGYDEDGNAFGQDEMAQGINYHWYNSRAIGTGPYRFVRYEQNVSIRLERWEEYYDELPPIETMVFRIIPESNTRLNELLSGGIDYLKTFLPTQYNQIVLEHGDEQFHDGRIEHALYQGTAYRYLGWNADRPQFSDRRVRRAMTHAFDRERMLEEVFYGLGRIQTGPFFIDAPETDPDIEPWEYDLELAASLLDEAGWIDSDNDGIRDRLIDGNRIDFEFSMVTYGYRPEFVAAMVIYQNTLATIGVEMNIDPVEWAVMSERMRERDFDAYTGGWVMSWESDPYQIWHSSQADLPGSSNRVGFRNSEADALMEEARLTLDSDERFPMYRRFHEIVHEEQPYTFFFAGREASAWRAHVQNVHFVPIRPFDDSSAWYITAD